MKPSINTIQSLCCALLMFVSSSAIAAPQYRWHAENNSEPRALATDFFKSKQQIDELTRVAVKVDIRIDGNQVVENIKSIWFYPKQTDIDTNGNDTVYWDEQVETLIIKEAGIVSPNGRYKRLSPNNVRIVNDDAYNIFTDTKKVILPYSGLSAGDVSVLEYEIRYPLSKLESNWSFSTYPVTNNPTLSFELRARSNSIKLNWSKTGDSITCDGSSQKLVCSAKNIDAYESDSGILWRDIIENVYLSSQSDWSEVVDESLKAFNAAELDSPEVAQLFSRLVDSSQPVADNIDLIHDYVARDIRYISLSELGHRVTPHTVASVDENRFGDCKDKTAAAVALLRKLGLDAYPVLVATTRRDPSALKTPSAGYFDHMIACFELDGERFCIDATDTDTHWSSVASWIRGRVVLPLQSNATPIRLNDKHPRWKFSSHTTLAFDGKAAQVEKQRRTYYSSYAGNIRSSLRSSSKEDRRDAMVDQYHSNVSDSVDPEFAFEKVDSLSSDLEVRSSAEYTPFLDPESDLDYTERDHWLRYELINSKLTTEHHDTEFAGMELDTSYEFDVSPLWNFSRLPATLNLNGKFGKLTRKVSLNNQGTLLVETSTNIPTQAIAKDQIEAFNDYLDLLTSESSMNMQGKLKKGSK